MRPFNPFRIALAVSVALLIQGVLFALLAGPARLDSGLIATPVANRDLEEIVRSGELRVAIPADGIAYAPDQERPDGFCLELAQRLARELRVELRAIAELRATAAYRELLKGTVDLVTLAEPADTTFVDQVAWSVPLGAARPMLVGQEAASITNITAVRGRQLMVKHLAGMEAVARQWQNQFVGELRVIAAPPEVAVDNLVRRAAAGTVPLLLLDENRARLEVALIPGLRHSAPLGEPLPIRWARRPGADKLAERVDRFLTQSRQAGLIAELGRRYLENPTRLRSVRRLPPSRTPLPPMQDLSPWDDLFRAAAKTHGLDWRLLAAVAFTESRFDPAAEHAGAMGLMQLVSQTAERFGATDPYDPDQNVRAGARHLSWLADQFDDVPEDQRLPFILAAYNIGLGHLFDAQDLARRRGLDPLQWTGHVATTLPLLEDPTISAELPRGRARGSATVGYVERVRKVYQRFAGACCADPEKTTAASVR